MGASVDAPYGSPDNSDLLQQDPGLPPVALDEAALESQDTTWTPEKIAVWVGILLQEVRIVW